MAALTIPSIAQSPPGYAASAVQAAPLLSPSQLQELVGRFALYPDDLIALILPASTTPLEIVKAQRFLTKYAADKSLKPDPSLSESVMNLLTYLNQNSAYTRCQNCQKCQNPSVETPPPEIGGFIKGQAFLRP